MSTNSSLSANLQIIVERRWFKGTSLTLIILSAILLGLETSAAIHERYGAIFHTVERAIVWAFTVELAMRIGAYGRRWHRFFTSGWNLFDFIVVASCFIPAVGELSAIARLARVLRAMRLVSFLPNLQLLVEALLKSFGSMGYVGLLLSMVFYVYGIIGVGLFGQTDGERFGSLISATVTLFQVLTLEGWVDIMSLHQTSYPIGAPLYFISFILLGTMIVLNLFIGVIVNGMSEAQESQLLAKARREGDDLVQTIQAMEEQLSQLKRIIDDKDGDTKHPNSQLNSRAEIRAQLAS